MRDVDFQTGGGESTAIFGKNGSGKSTFLKSLSGARKIDKGKILLNGESVSKSGVRRRIGFVPQNDVLFDDLSASDNLVFWGAAYGFKKNEVLKNPVIGLLDVDGILNKKAGALSGGMRKRLNFASSLLHNPDILILDEPFSGIDIVVKHELMEYLMELKKKGKSLVVTSHNLSELSALCEKFCFISGGSVRFAGNSGLDGFDVGFDIDNEESVAKIIKRGE